MLWSQDLVSSFFKMAKLIFFNGKIIWFWCCRCSLLILINITPKRQLKISGIVALMLSLQVMIKLNWERNSAQWTRHWFSCFVVIKVQKFLQSVKISNNYLVLQNLKRHFFNIFIITRNSLLYILQLYLKAKCLAKKNATSLSLPFLLV